jgi:hypothetical protein
MVLGFRSSARLVALVAAAALGGATGAAAALTGASPFLPPAAAGQATATPDSQLELRGIMASGSTTMFSIYDATHKSSAWVRLNEPGRDFVVRSFDAGRDAVTVDYQGRTLTLALHTAKVVSAPVNVPQPAIATPGVPGPQPIGGPVVLNPTPADEQRRLEAIAAEVNRRRMIRQQALQASRQAAGQPPSAPAPNVPPPGAVPPNPNRTR